MADGVGEGGVSAETTASAGGSTESGSSGDTGTAGGASGQGASGAGPVYGAQKTEGQGEGGQREAQEPTPFGESDLDRLVELKIYGQTQKVPLRDLIAMKQRDEAPEVRHQRAIAKERELAQKAAQIEEQMQMFQQNPMGMLPPEQILRYAQQLVEQQEAINKMTPEQMAIYNAQKQYEQVISENQKLKAQFQEQMVKQQTDNQVQMWKRNLMPILQKTGWANDKGHVPASMAERIATYQRDNLNPDGSMNADYESMVQLIQEDIYNENAAAYRGLKGPSLLSVFPREIQDEFARAYVNAYFPQPQNGATTQTQTPAPPAGKWKTREEYEAFLRNQPLGE